DDKNHTGFSDSSVDSITGTWTDSNRHFAGTPGLAQVLEGSSDGTLLPFKLPECCVFGTATERDHADKESCCQSSDRPERDTNPTTVKEDPDEDTCKQGEYKCSEEDPKVFLLKFHGHFEHLDDLGYLALTLCLLWLFCLDLIL